jgi:DNA-directed RNA polymerase beta' subunit
MSYKFKKSNAEVGNIKGIQFSILNPNFVKNISVTQNMEYMGESINKGIYKDICYDPTSGQANYGGINDPRMGSMFDSEHPGYFGHIDMTRPVYHIGFLKIIIDVLKCVSYYTSELLVDAKELNLKKGKKRNLKELTKICKTIKKCPTTGKTLPTYSKEGTKISVDFGEGKSIISTQEVYKILEKISDNDVGYLGFNPKYTKPKYLMITCLPVPPPHVRPSVFMNSSQKCDDDLTTKLNEIVKTNKAYNTAIERNQQDLGTNEHYISQLESLLQYNVNTYMDNQHPGQPPSLQRSGKPLKTLRERLAGKEGRVRGNLMGKRVDYSARTVITADPNLSIDQVGVPFEIALNLTVPEVVTDYNKEKLLELVKNGPHKHPGAKFLVKNASKLDLNYAKDIEKLENGWVVERHISDGDIVLFNRQPSLHKMSIMAHRVKVLQGLTFRLNLAVTSPYNADFDGDEMNLHVPQNLNSRAEAECLMTVDRMIVSPQANKPVMGIIQDSLLASTVITRKNIFITRDMLMNIIMIIDGWDGIIPKPAVVLYKEGKYEEYWTGKQVYSLIIPKTIYVDNGNLASKLKKDLNKDDRCIYIHRGELLSGVIDKSIVGKSQGSLIHILFNDRGCTTTKVFLNQIQKITNYWIKHYGFTIGIGDTIPNEETIKKVEQILTTTNEKIKELIEDKQYLSEHLEELINVELNAATNEAGKCAEESLTFENGFKAAVASGSKGSNINISQIMAAVGQQNVEGQRIGYGFRHRTLPHFPKHDVGQQSRGFVENSYLKGLNPQEFFFHAMAGREGLIDTACKSVTGDTKIIIIENGESKCVEIGEWIDTHMNNNKGDIHYYEEQEDTEYLNFKHEIYVPTCDKYGKTSWGKVTGCTRHDPTPDMYEVTTYGGRTVKVTESTSLIVWDGKQLRKRITSTIKIGECVPLLETLPEPPIITKYVDMSKYFPKNEYIHGTDFYVAKKLMEIEMTRGLIGEKAGKEAKAKFNRVKIPKGWWDKTNGTEFTLPYTKKSSLQRAIVRSQEIETNKIYPYGGSRSVGLFDKFELNEENGKFIGLYLAEGNSRIEGGTVCISNNDKGIRDFVQKWFEDNGMKSQENIRKFEDGTESSGVRGYSTLFAKFLVVWVGHLSQNKYVPNEVYSAPKEFIIGLLNGYFSGDGCVSDKSNIISASSASEKLINSISFLCNRIGVYGRIRKHQIKKNNKGSKNILPTYTFTINGQWSKIFAKQVPLMIDYKQKGLNEILKKKDIKHKNYITNENVILDKIIKIEKIEHKQKVYDLTVPSTSHFCGISLINSNTSEIGYVQRRLVKALEDVKICYDHTVRNGKGTIVQFLYGEDGLDATYLENVHVEMLKCNQSELIEQYCTDDLKEEFEVVLFYHKKLLEVARQREINQSKYDDDVYPMPVNIARILRFARNLNYDTKTTLLPNVCFKEVCGLVNKIETKFLESLNDPQRSYNSSIILRAYIHSSLCYKKINYLSWEQLIYTLEEIEFKFNRAIATPGEMCGILAAQSIGEPATQLTLNSVEYNTNLVIQWTHPYELPPVRPTECAGLFIDKLIETYPSKCQVQPDGVTIYLPLEKGTAKAMSTDEDGNVMWTELEAVTRHPPINKDGSSTLIKVTTKTGREVICTKAKSFLTYNKETKKIIPKNGSDLSIGDPIPIVNSITWCDNRHVKSSVYIDNFGEMLIDSIFGKFIGFFLLNGIIIEGSVLIQINNEIDIKEISNLCNYYGIKYEIKNTIEFYIHCESIKKFLVTHCYTSNYDKCLPEFVYTSPTIFIQHILRILSNGHNDYEHESLTLINGIALLIHEGFQIIRNKDIYKIRYKHEDSFEALRDVLFDTIVKLEDYVSEHPYVYDLTVEKTRNMMCTNGLCIADTFHYAGVSAKNVTLGVPRLKELINITKKLKSPSLTLYENNYVSQFNETAQQRIIETLRSKIEYKILQDLVYSSDIIYLNKLQSKEDKYIVSLYKSILQFSENICLKFSFKQRDLEYVDISLQEIAGLIKKNLPLKILCSDDNYINPAIYILSNDFNELRKIEIFCMSIKLKGCENIDRVYTRKFKHNQWDPEKGHYKVDQWLLETEGSNIVESMKIDGIDHYKTISNNIIEIYETFGIEAARLSLINELRIVLSFDGSYVNYRHLSILVDTMTYRGSLTAMTRHGINRVNDVGVLTKSSFEETVEILTDAAAFSEFDPLKGISDNIMLGKLIPAGTGFFDVLYDYDVKPSSDIDSDSGLDHSDNKGINQVQYIPTEPDYDPLSPWPF